MKNVRFPYTHAVTLIRMGSHDRIKNPYPLRNQIVPTWQLLGLQEPRGLTLMVVSLETMRFVTQDRFSMKLGRGWGAHSLYHCIWQN